MLIAGGAAHFVNKLQIRRLMSGEFAQVHRALAPSQPVNQPAGDITTVFNQRTSRKTTIRVKSEWP